MKLSENVYWCVPCEHASKECKGENKPYYTVEGDRVIPLSLCEFHINLPMYSYGRSEGNASTVEKSSNTNKSFSPTVAKEEMGEQRDGN